MFIWSGCILSKAISESFHEVIKHLKYDLTL